MLKGIKARENRRVCWQGEGSGRIGTLEENSAPGQFVERRGEGLFAAVASEMIGPRRIERDQNQIQFRLALGDRPVSQSLRPKSAKPIPRHAHHAMPHFRLIATCRILIAE